MKVVSTFECPTSKGMIVTDFEGYEFHDVGIGFRADFTEVWSIDKLLQKYNLELCIDSKTYFPTTYVAIKPIIQEKKKMDILKIVLTALSIKVEKYVNKIVKYVEQNK